MILRQTIAMLRKEMLTEWRMRARVTGIFWFALALVLMVAFASPSSDTLREMAGGTLWVAVLLASTRSLDQSYNVEFEQGAMEGLTLWPVDPIALFLGKALANMVILLLVTIAVLPALFAIYDAQVTGSVVQLVAVLVLGCAAIASPGTVIGLITAQARGSSVMLPLLMFPLVVPALLGASSATTALFDIHGDTLQVAPKWIFFLGVFNVVHWSVSAALYGTIFED